MTVANEEQIRWWNEDEGPHWVTEAERYDAINGAFGEAMLEAAALQPSERVLDVGCGNGATTIEAAKRVRPGGAAVGMDVSAPMLDLARRRATSAEVSEAEFLHADAQVHDFVEGDFDVVVSRHGLMFFDDPDLAFANLARALRPDGRMVFVAPQGLERAEWIMAAGSAGGSPHRHAAGGQPRPARPARVGRSQPDPRAPHIGRVHAGQVGGGGPADPHRRRRRRRRRLHPLHSPRP